MTADFAISKETCQALTLPVAIGIGTNIGDNRHMGKVPPRRRRQGPHAYIREWIRAFQLRPAELAKAADINEGYLSQLISGQKTNPSPGFLIDLAAVFPQPFHYTMFYQLPPDDHTLKTLAALDPALLANLKAPR